MCIHIYCIYTYIYTSIYLYMCKTTKASENKELPRSTQRKVSVLSLTRTFFIHNIAAAVCIQKPYWNQNGMLTPVKCFFFFFSWPRTAKQVVNAAGTLARIAATSARIDNSDEVYARVPGAVRTRSLCNILPHRRDRLLPSTSSAITIGSSDFSTWEKTNPGARRTTRTNRRQRDNKLSM